MWHNQVAPRATPPAPGSRPPPAIPLMPTVSAFGGKRNECCCCHLCCCCASNMQRLPAVGQKLDRYRTYIHVRAYICTWIWNGIEVHPELSAKGGGKGAVRSMRYLQFIAAMGIQMGKGRKVGGEADGAGQTTEERTVHGNLNANQFGAFNAPPATWQSAPHASKSNPATHPTSKHSIAHNSNKQVARIMKGSEFCTGPKSSSQMK
ncbi:GM17231 [Drosophila sechellia]|uniref:GM17231 n=1 Tax=Drosophila sechellia TaxID=7238 RepID=B4I590_DROSE|nr:GM17231 [Drosophila sechellia]